MTKDIVMASEGLGRPGGALWSVNEIRYSDIEHDRVKDDSQLLYLLAAASFTEMTSDLYAHNLVAFFAEDREAIEWLQQRWEPEERQHGIALKLYVQTAWPDFDWDVAYRGFFSEFSQCCSMEALERSRALELVARCVVETGTSAFYGMLAAANFEPVLTQLVSNIRADEIRHYKYFYRHFLKYCERERPGRMAILKTLVKRAAEVQSEEQPIAFKHVYLAGNPASGYRRTNYDSYRQAVRGIAKLHLNREMAMKMMLKPLGLGVMIDRIGLSLATSLCGVLLR
jgi:hypothetical protein